MECSCYCDADYDDSDCQWVDWVKARTRHLCCECGEYIEPGQHYERVRWVYDGSWSRVNTCETCYAIRDDLCRSWVYGELREVIYECFGFDYVTGEFDCPECSYTLAHEDQVCPECGWEA